MPLFLGRDYLEQEDTTYSRKHIVAVGAGRGTSPVRPAVVGPPGRGTRLDARHEHRAARADGLAAVQQRHAQACPGRRDREGRV